MRKQIDKLMVETSYDYAKKVHQHQKELNSALDKIVQISNMDRGSAIAYINAFRKMMEGSEYTRTINLMATEYFLSHILSDYGKQQLELAIRSVKLHVKYYKKIKNVYLRSTNELADRFEKYLLDQMQK